MAITLAALAGLALAFANGANDNFKGVATLFGAGTTNYRRALTWATATTLLGSITALLLSGGLLQTFRGSGIVPPEVFSEAAFPAAVAVAAAATVLIATLIGMPISTTHALIGGLIGAGLSAAGAAIGWDILGRKVMLPLLSSPLIAFSGSAALYLIFKMTRRQMRVEPESCVCIPPKALATVAAPSDWTTPLLLTQPLPAVVMGSAGESSCAPAGALTASKTLDTAHFLSAGSVGFARGLNDTPKIAALLLVAPSLQAGPALVAVGLGMAAGAWLAARRVAETLSHRITKMNAGQGFTANLVTALLVVVASRLGLPVSTTHVSCGSLIGIGAAGRSAHWKMIGRVLLAWVVTLPMAGGIAWASYTLLSS